MAETRTSFCRICTALCPIVVTIEDGRAVKVAGDPQSPLYEGYTCPKGRAIPEQHNDPSRLLTSLRREADGTFASIASERALDEIAERLKKIIDSHGPDSVALYYGTAMVSFPAMVQVASAFMRAIGSSMIFTPNTIDKPGSQIAQAAHGTWQAGHPPFEEAEAWILIGLNPVISKSGGFPPNNPARRLKEAVARGMKLIVIDPRVTESTARAHIHLQAKPGTDFLLLAAMIHVVLNENLHDVDFVTRHTIGLESLREAVTPFSPDIVAEIADVPVDKLVEAARIFANARYAGIGCGVGPSFALHGGLTDYLVANLMTLCGFRSRAGDIVAKPHVLLPAYAAKAQAWGPIPYRNLGKKLRVRDLACSASGMPTAALPEEILLEGAGQVKALLCLAGNPLAAWPDRRRTYAALQTLDLLVTAAYDMTETAKLSDYVIAPKLPLEIPGDTKQLEQLRYHGSLRGIEGAYARYTPAVTPPPPGSDLLEDWELFYGLAQRMGVPLELVSTFGMLSFSHQAPHRIVLDMQNKPTADQLLEMLNENSRIPFDEVKKHPHGALFDVSEEVQPPDPDWIERLDLGNAEFLAELASLRPDGIVGTDPQLPFLLISRRVNNIMNSFGLNLDRLRGERRYNPAFMHPGDLADLGMTQGDIVEIRSAHGVVVAIVEPDPSLRRGLVSMTHCYGGSPLDGGDVLNVGTNVNDLTDAAAEFDPITGLPRMGALPVRVSRPADVDPSPLLEKAGAQHDP